MKFCTLNARGLGNRTKRKSIFQFLQKQKADVVFVQETHLDEDNIKTWEAEWGGKLIVSNGDSKSRGTAILVHPTIDIKVDKVSTDGEGRLICCKMEYENKNIVMGNVYAPNQDSPEFFEEVIRNIDSFEDNDMVILGGDFNLVMNPELDRYESCLNNERSCKILQEYLNRAKMCDAWRLTHPEGRRYTWHRFNRDHRPSSSRIDMFFISECFADCIQKCEIETGYLTDHSLVTLEIRIDNFTRGPGIWRLNNKHLDDPEYCALVERTIVDTDKASPLANPCEKWEFIKMKLAQESVAYAKNKAKNRTDVIKNLKLLKDELQAQILRNPGDSDVTTNLLNLNRQLDMFAMDRAEGAIFRSKCQYVRDGEKNSAYFFSLEKKRYYEKNMKSVILDDGTETTHQKSILDEQTRFYKYLYESDQNVVFNIRPDGNERILSELEKRECEQPLLDGEFFDAVMTLKSNKVCGIDGLPVEFYRKFWKLLSPYLISMYHYSFKYKLLPESTRKGLISLLPKRNKNPKLVKDRRPLTLLCSDYKILAKALDNRLKLILPKIISTDQSGFIAGRRISYNLRKSLDIIEYTRLKKLPGLILSIDMQKCFDRLEHAAIFSSLRYFNFGEDFIRWVSLFYTDFRICTQNFGYLSIFWTKGRGINQGCPISPGIYLLTAEILSNKLKNCSNVKGITVNSVEYLISQFADDTDLYLMYDQNTLNSAFDILTSIENSTGLKVSYDKTTIYRIGSMSDSNAKLYTSKPVKWSNEYINTLGVDIGNSSKICESNVDTVIQKMRAVSNIWYYRRLTLTGKILIINTLMSSLFVYRLQVLTYLTGDQVKRIDAVVEHFLWKDKRPKVSLRVLKANKEDGGMGLMDIERKHTALMLTWQRQCIDNECVRNLAEAFLGPWASSTWLWKLNLNEDDCRKKFCGDSFWHTLMHKWSKFNYHEPQSRETVEDQVLWCNSMIKVTGRWLDYKEYTKMGIYTVSDIRDGNRFLTYEELIRKFKVRSNWLQYQTLIGAIPAYWKTLLNSEVFFDDYVPFDLKLSRQKHVSRYIYYESNHTNEYLNHVARTWYVKTGVDKGATDYAKCFLNINLVTNITKLRDFQYRLLHNKIFCNDILIHWKKVDSNVCNLCHSEKQTIVHLMWDCRLVRPIWSKIEEIFGTLDLSCTFELWRIITNLVHENPAHVCNFLVLVVKQLIYRMKCQNKPLLFEVVRNEIYLVHKIEEYNAKRKNLIRKHNKKWSPVRQLLLYD